MTSPTFNGSTSFRNAGFSSCTFSGPTRPPLAFDGESETSAATCSNASPASTRLRAFSAFSLAASSAATLTPLIGHRHFHEDLANGDRARRRELLGVLGVVLPRFFLGDADLVHHLALRHARDQHLPLERLPQVGHRHAFLLERRLKCLVCLELVFLADVRDDLVEFLVGQLLPELASSLRHQQLVDRVDDQIGRDLVDRLLQRGVVGGLDAFRPQHLDLTMLELGFRDDVAVHLHEDLLDDLGRGVRDTEGQRQRGDESGRTEKSMHRRVFACQASARGVQPCGSARIVL